MTIQGQIDQSSTSGSASAGRVTVAGNRKIAQVFEAGYSGNLVAVRVNVSCTAGSASPVISVYSVVNGIISKDPLRTVSPSTQDTVLSGIVAFTSPFQQVAGMTYAIVVEYPKGRSSDKISWTASQGADSNPPCYIWDGSTWKVQATVCDFITLAIKSETITSETPQEPSTEARSPVTTKTGV
jgi:hypothetical protein